MWLKRNFGAKLAWLALAALVIAGVVAWVIRPNNSSVEPPSQEVAIAPQGPDATIAPEREPAISSEPQPPQIGDAFVERFAGPELGARWQISDGWSNGEWMANDWRASQVSVTPGRLRITLAPAKPGSTKPLAGGEIRTRAGYRYGYFEVRMRAPHDPGIVTGVFTYAPRDGGILPEEIDMEIAGRDTHTLEVTYHQGGIPKSKKVELPFDAADGFHIYAFDWRPDELRWYVDGALVHTENGAGVRRLIRPQQFLTSLWASRTLSAWTGDIDATQGPWLLDVACLGYSPSRPEKPLCAD
jgi:hypothetical protein